MHYQGDKFFPNYWFGIFFADHLVKVSFVLGTLLYLAFLALLA
jgi:hypothetical protein